MITAKPDNEDHSHRLENKERDKITIDYISGLIDEEVAMLKDEIEKQNIKIKKINKKLNDFEKTIMKK